MPGDNIVISMLGDADGNGACGFAVLDAKTFEIKGRWENGGPHPQLNYDFWYQPRQNVLASSEFGEPNAYEGGFDPEDVAAGRYGSRLHFWNLSERRVEQTLELGETGLVPLEIRWLHDPDADEGFVGAALSSTMWHFHRDNGSYSADQVIARRGRRAGGLAVPGPRADHRPRRLDGRPLPVLLELAARRPAPVRHLRPGEPAAHRAAAARRRARAGRWTAAATLNGGPQMLQLSLDGRRLYVTNSLYSTWDNQFYPGAALVAAAGRTATRTAAWSSTRTSSSTSDPGAARHEVRLQGGDCTTEIFQ